MRGDGGFEDGHSQRGSGSPVHPVEIRSNSFLVTDPYIWKYQAYLGYGVQRKSRGLGFTKHMKGDDSTFLSQVLLGARRGVTVFIYI